MFGRSDSEVWDWLVYWLDAQLCTQNVASLSLINCQHAVLLICSVYLSILYAVLVACQKLRPWKYFSEVMGKITVYLKPISKRNENLFINHHVFSFLIIFSLFSLVLIVYSGRILFCLWSQNFWWGGAVSHLSSAAGQI